MCPEIPFATETSGGIGDPRPEAILPGAACAQLSVTGAQGVRFQRSLQRSAVPLHPGAFFKLELLPPTLCTLNSLQDLWGNFFS